MGKPNGMRVSTTRPSARASDALRRYQRMVIGVCRDAGAQPRSPRTDPGDRSRRDAGHHRLCSRNCCKVFGSADRDRILTGFPHCRCWFRIDAPYRCRRTAKQMPPPWYSDWHDRCAQAQLCIRHDLIMLTTDRDFGTLQIIAPEALRRPLTLHWCRARFERCTLEFEQAASCCSAVFRCRR